MVRRDEWEWKVKWAKNKNKSQVPNFSSGIPSSHCCYTLREWVNYLTNVIIIIIKKGWLFKAERESDIHPISTKTSAPQYQPIHRRKEMEKQQKTIVGIEQLRPIRKHWTSLNPTSPTPSNTELARSFQRDTERGIKVLRYCRVLQQGGA